MIERILPTRDGSGAFSRHAPEGRLFRWTTFGLVILSLLSILHSLSLYLRFLC